MYLLMDEGGPFLSIGGSSDANAVLPAVGWYRLADIAIYTLPLTTKFLASKALRVLHLPTMGSAVARSEQRSWPTWAGFLQPRSRTQRWHHLAPSDLSEPMPFAAGIYDLVPLLEKQHLEWLYAAPKQLGTFFCLAFPEDSKVTAFTLGRLFRYQDLTYAKLIHLQTSSPSVEAYAGMLAGTLRYLSEQKADVALCRASCPFLRRALKRGGFIRSAVNPTFWCAKNRTLVQGNFHLTFLRGDDGIRPYPD